MVTKRLERDRELLQERRARAQAAEQPYVYPPSREWAEPDWTRIPGYRDVTREQWESARWQRQHSVKNLGQLKAALGDLLPADLEESIARDQA